MIVAVEVISYLVNFWKMSHFGRKPISGGSPARESKVSMRVVLSMGALSCV